LKYPIAVRLAMMKIEFMPEEIDALEYERYHHPIPKSKKRWRLSISKARE
jgi:hypothetical protein